MSIAAASVLAKPIATNIDQIHEEYYVQLEKKAIPPKNIEKQ
jgi:hypothetical protein